MPACAGHPRAGNFDVHAWNAQAAVLKPLVPYIKGIYRFMPGDGNSWLKSSLGDWHLVTSGGPTNDPYGKTQYCAYFDGSDDYLTTADDTTDFAFGTSDFFISLWARFASTSASHGFCRHITGTKTGWGWHHNSSNGTYFMYGDGSTVNQLLMATWVPDTTLWYHLVLFRRGNVVYFYRNGALMGSATLTVADSTINSLQLDIGRGAGLTGGNWDSRYFNGRLDEVIIGKGRGLTVPEVLALYNNGYGAFGRQRYFGDWTANRDVLGVKNGNILAAWPLADQTDACGSFDLCSGGASFASDATMGTCADFESSESDQLYLPSTPMRLRPNDKIAVSFWVKLESQPSEGNQFVFFASENSAAYNWHLQYATISGAGRFYWQVRQSGGSDVNVTVTGQTMTLDTWYHIMCVADGSNLKIFKNGKQIGTDTAYDGTIKADPGAFRLGNRKGADWLDGKMANLVIWGGIAMGRPEAAVLAGYNDPYTVLLMHMDGSDDGTTFTDDSTVGLDSPHTVTRYNAVTKTGTKQLGTASAYFDGSGDYLSIADSADWNFGTGDFTVDFWLRVPSLPGGAMSGLITHRENDSNLVDIGLMKDYPSSGKYSVMFYVRSGGTTRTEATFEFVGISTNTWYHLAVVRFGGVIKWFKDGISQPLWVNYQPGYTCPDTATPLLVGRVNGYPAYDFPGYIDELRISNGIARWTSDFTPPTAPYSLSSNTVPVTCSTTKPWDSSTVLLLPMDGDNGSTKVVDLMGRHAPLVVNGAYIGTADKAIGTAAAVFDGSDDRVEIAASRDWYLGDTWTIEFWAKGAAATGLLGWNLSGGGNTYVYFGHSGTALNCTYVSGGVVSWKCRADCTWPTDQWNHVALVQNKGGIFKWFLNGRLVVNTDGNGGTWPDLSTYVMSIGAMRNESGWNYYACKIDDLRIKNEAVYLNDFAVPSRAHRPLRTPEPDTGTVLLMHMDGDNDGQVFTDSSINGVNSPHAMTRSGDAVTKTAVYKFGNSSGYFDGTGDCVTTPASRDWDFGAGDFTIDFWVRFNSIASPPDQALMGNGYNAGWCIDFVTSSPDIRLYYKPSGSYSNKTFTFSPSINTWYHLAFVRCSGQIAFFKDGARQGAWQSFTDTISYPSGNSLYIGGDAASSERLNGYMDEVRISKGIARWTSDFTPPTAPYADPSYQYSPDRYTSLLLHMDGANDSSLFVDSSPFARTVTCYNALTKSAQKKFGVSSGYFDGSGDYLSIADSVDWAYGAGDFTIDFWVRFTAVDKHICLMSQRVDTGNMVEIYLVKDTPSAGHYALSFYVRSGGTTRTEVYFDFSPSVDTWYHVAYSRASGVAKWFKDGVSQTLSANTGADWSIGDYAAPLLIGRANGDASQDFPGYIDEFRISKGIARWTSNFTPPTSQYEPAIAYEPYTALLLHMDGEESGTTFTDASINARAITRSGAITKTAVSKFGTASCYFDGSDDSLSVPDSSDWAFGTGPFTIEAWVRMNSASSGHLIGQYADSSNWWDLEVSSTTITWNYKVSGSYVVAWHAGSLSLADGLFHHIAVTRDGDTWYCFVDGVAKTKTLDAGAYSGTLSDIAAVLAIGRRLGANDTPLSAYVDELRVSRGIARWTADFTPPSFPYEMTPKLQPYSDPQTVLLLHMNGDDSGTMFVDSSPYAKSISRYNAITKVAMKKFGTASGYFDGSDDYLSIPASDDWAFGSGDFTVDFWMNTSVTPKAIIGTANHTSGSVGWVIYAWNNGDLLIEAEYSGSWGVNITAATTVSDGNWHHIAWVRSGSNMQVYVDGVSVYSGTNTTNITGASRVLEIGRGVENANYYSGYLDEVRISKGIARWTGDFTPPVGPYASVVAYDPYNVLLMHMDGADSGTEFTDSSLSAHAVTRYGAVTKTAAKKFGVSSVYFDGSDDYLEIADSADWSWGNGDWTVDFWINFTTLTSGVRYDILGIYGSDNKLFYFYTDTDNKFYFGIHASSYQYTSVARSGYTTGTWYHWAAVRSGRDIKWYIGGTQVGSTITADGACPDVARALRLGVLGYGTNFFNGYIDEFRISKGVARWTAAFTPPASAYE